MRFDGAFEVLNFDLHAPHAREARWRRFHWRGGMIVPVMVVAVNSRKVTVTPVEGAFT
jgi:hypothetical protein